MRQITHIQTQDQSEYDLLKQIMEMPAFHKTIEKIRGKWKIDVHEEIVLSEYDQPSDHQKRLLKNRLFIKDLKDLFKKFKLDAHWTLYIQNYIFLDVIAYKYFSKVYLIKGTENDADPITGEPVYHLRIFPSTTQEDVINAWKKINEVIHKGKDIRQNISKNLNRDKTIFKLAQIKYPIEEIHSQILKQYKQDLDYGSIITIYSRYLKNMGIKNAEKLKFKKGGQSLTTEQIILAQYPDNDL